ncbi:hypothetical protein PACILC2_53810 [Paenibacillus cisolokensis]|uniref:Uncharacterized protein n=1 Tax=Paenibacillus cisolokensis TaxID=1658519 RepID=A0ABQ4NFR4_9BACL|nr:hypothetical protein [Paenibacillus cisolokensis]GIQ66813.1 hypothetical protein PACILC2_53810 [Paenibacillus cisolokensis]
MILEKHLVEFATSLNITTKRTAHQNLGDTIAKIKNQKVDFEADVVDYNNEFISWLEEILKNQEKYLNAFEVIDIENMRVAVSEQKKYLIKLQS